MREIKKDGGIFGGRMGEREWAAGRAMQARMMREGRFTNASINTEDTSPKTWILWRGAKNPAHNTIECEIQLAPSSDGLTQAAMLVGQCPVCFEEYGKEHFFHVHEDNKKLEIEWVNYGKLPPDHHVAHHWKRHCEEKLGRHPASDDKVALVTSPERWQCDYCLMWCVRVTDSVAVTDTKGATVLWVDQKAASSR